MNPMRSIPSARFRGTIARGDFAKSGSGVGELVTDALYGNFGWGRTGMKRGASMCGHHAYAHSVTIV
jgi:hypothetical protein